MLTSDRASACVLVLFLPRDECTAEHSRLRRSWPLTERLRRSTARLRRDTLIPSHRLSLRVMWVMQMLAYRYVRAVHVESEAGASLAR